MKRSERFQMMCEDLETLCNENNDSKALEIVNDLKESVENGESVFNIETKAAKEFSDHFGLISENTNQYTKDFNKIWLDGFTEIYGIEDESDPIPEELSEEDLMEFARALNVDPELVKEIAKEQGMI